MRDTNTTPEHYRCPLWSVRLGGWGTHPYKTAFPAGEPECGTTSRWLHNPCHGDETNMRHGKVTRDAPGCANYIDRKLAQLARPDGWRNLETSGTELARHLGVSRSTWYRGIDLLGAESREAWKALGRTSALQQGSDREWLWNYADRYCPWHGAHCPVEDNRQVGLGLGQYGAGYGALVRFRIADDGTKVIA